MITRVSPKTPSAANASMPMLSAVFMGRSVGRLGGERDGSRSRERLTEPREHRQVGVKLDAGESARAERCQAVLVLSAREGAFDAAALGEHLAEPWSAARDERVPPVGLDPDGLGRALARGAAPG